MGELVKSASVSAPRQAVFDFVADPYNAPRYISSITDVTSGPRGQAQKGERWQANANFMGQRTRLALILEEIQAPDLVRYALHGEPSAQIEIVLREDSAPGRTNVSLKLSVPSVPALFLNALMGGLLSGDLERLRAALEV